MTEELKQKAEIALNKRLGTYGYVNKDMCYKPYTEGYIDGATESTKELNKKLSQAEADYDKMFWQKNEIISNLQAQIEKMKECANCPVWLLNQSEKNCKDCEYKEALILLRR